MRDIKLVKEGLESPTLGFEGIPFLTRHGVEVPATAQDLGKAAALQPLLNKLEELRKEMEKNTNETRPAANEGAAYHRSTLGSRRGDPGDRAYA